MKIVAQRIKELRKNCKLSQQELGDKLGVGKTTISNWENEYSTPDADSLVRLSNILDTTTDYILGKAEIRHGVVLDGDRLPKELQGIVEEIEILKDALNNGLSKDDIKEILGAAKKIKRKS